MAMEGVGMGGVLLWKVALLRRTGTLTGECSASSPRWWTAAGPPPGRAEQVRGRSEGLAHREVEADPLLAEGDVGPRVDVVCLRHGDTGADPARRKEVLEVEA